MDRLYKKGVKYMSKILIIAEIGINHQGDVNIAKELISYVTQIAKDSNCYKIILDCKESLV